MRSGFIQKFLVPAARHADVKKAPLAGGAMSLSKPKSEVNTIMLQAKSGNGEAAAMSAPDTFQAAVKPSDIARFRERIAGLIKHGETMYMHIEPWQAEILLERNDRNRPVKKTHVAFLAREMAAERWHVTGQPIIFNKSGSLQDGQHRLKACIEAGVSFQTLVVFGITADAYVATDVGVKRSAGDMLHHAGIANWNAAAAAARLVMIYDAGQLRATQGKTFSNEQIVEWVQNNQTALARSIEYGGRAYGRGRLIQNSLACALHFIFARLDPDRADDFLERFGTGVGIESKSDPIGRFRDRLIENAGSRAKLPLAHIAAIAIKAWNAYRAGTTIGVLRWTPKEDFPVAE